MFNSKWILFLSIVSLLSGCARPDRGIPTESAGFYVESLGGSHLPQYDEESQKNLGFPVTKHYMFKACLKDRFNHIALRGHHFIITGGGKEEKKSKSDEGGCVHWSEEIPFNYFKPYPIYVILERTISNEGVLAGTQKVKIAVNPWADRESGMKEVVDVREGRRDIPERRLKSALITHDILNSKKNKATMNVDILSGQFTPVGVKAYNAKQTDAGGKEVNLTIGNVDEMEGKWSVNLSLKMMPQIFLEMMGGGYKPIKLNRGQFEVNTYIVVVKSNEQRVVLWKSKQGEVASVAIDGAMTISHEAPLEAKVYEETPVYLGIQVTPSGFLKDYLKPYEGLFRIGNFHDLEQSGLKAIRSERDSSKGFSFNEYIGGAAWGANLTKIDKATLYNIDNLEFASEGIKLETLTRRVHAFNATTCVHEGVQRNPVIKKTFRVLRYPDIERYPRLIDGTFLIHTDEQGCMSLPGRLEHLYFQKESHVRVGYVLCDEDLLRDAGAECVSPDEDVTGREESRAVRGIKLVAVMNPWDARKGVFGRDARVLSSVRSDDEDRGGQVTRGKSSPKSAIFIPHATLEQQNVNYSVDKYMNLTVKKQIHASFRGRTLRHHALSKGRSDNLILRQGAYFVEALLYKKYKDPFATKIEALSVQESSSERSDKKTKEDNRVKGETVSKEEPKPPSDADSIESEDLIRIKDSPKFDDEDYYSEHISHSSHFVNSEGGYINTTFEFPIKDYRILRIRNFLLLKVTPVDELKAKIFSLIWKDKDFRSDIREFLSIYDNSTQSSESCEGSGKSFWDFYDEKVPLTKLPLSEKTLKYLDCPANSSVRQGSCLIPGRNLDLNQEPEKKASTMLFSILKRIHESSLTREDFEVLQELQKKEDDSEYNLYESGCKKRVELDKEFFFASESLGLDGRTFVSSVDFRGNTGRSTSIFLPVDPVEEGSSVSEHIRATSLENPDLEHDPQQVEQIKQFFRADINEYLKREEEMQKSHAKEMKVKSLLYNYMKLSNLEYVNLKKGVPFKKFKESSDCKLRKYDERVCFEDADTHHRSIDDFLDFLNESKDEEARTLKEVDLKNLITKAVFDDPRTSSSFCRQLSLYLDPDSFDTGVLSDRCEEFYEESRKSVIESTDLFFEDTRLRKKLQELWKLEKLQEINQTRNEEEKLDPQKDLDTIEVDEKEFKKFFYQDEEVAREFQKRLSEHYQRNPYENPFILRRKYLVKEVGDVSYRNAKQFNMGASAENSLTHMEGVNTNIGISFTNWTKLLSAGAGAASTLGAWHLGRAIFAMNPIFGISLGGGIGTLVGMVTGVVAQSFWFSKDIRVSTQAQQGSRAEERIFLIVQITNFDVNVKKYIECLEVRWNPFFVKGYLQGFGLPGVNVRNPLYSAGLKSYFFRYEPPVGQFICSDEEVGKNDVSGKAITLPEVYALTYQFFKGSGGFVDNKGLINNPWTLSLRGVSDINKFITAIREFNPIKDGDMLRKFGLDPEKGASVGSVLDAIFTTDPVTQDTFTPLAIFSDVFMRANTPSFPGLIDGHSPYERKALSLSTERTGDDVIFEKVDQSEEEEGEEERKEPNFETSGEETAF